MKVLHINSNYLHTPLYSEMIYELEQQNVQSDVIMPRKINDDKHLSEHLVKHHAQVWHHQILKPLDRFFYFTKQRKILNWIAQQKISIAKYDIIHAHTLFSDGYIAFKMKRPFIITVRNTDVNYYLKYYKHLKPVGRAILKQASAIIFLSETYKMKVLKQLFDEKEQINMLKKTTVIPNGINEYWIEHASNLKKTMSDEVNILFVGRIMRNKNIHFLAENLQKQYVNKKVRLFVVGDIKDKKYAKLLAEYSNVTLIGKQSQKDIIRLMENMHIFTMVSFNESFGLVYLEALTQQLPVIYTKNEGFDLYYPDGKVGYAISPKDGNELIKKVIDLIKHYEAFQNRISHLDKDRFGWSENARRHNRIYQEVSRNYSGDL
ncbi:glycosyltransferase family 4 protein [Staphylococcus warneri]|uniref:glycosyltransferase family 4 protein n=1 Tax=Staphylococcus warneri TaxID=1292 RepID=UPI0032610A73